MNFSHSQLVKYSKCCKEDRNVDVTLLMQLSFSDFHLLIFSLFVIVRAAPAVLLFQDVWARSLCRTIEKLVEVVQEYPSEVEHIYSPACVPLVRCAGCCGDEKLECHPTITTNITMQLLKIRPAELGEEYVEMTFVEHQTCECSTIITVVIVCRGRLARSSVSQCRGAGFDSGSGLPVWSLHVLPLPV
uniref:Placental growth factor b n=1 Tax=Hippocampus comes TaxID=109280 RepID=A0A3Q2XE73_HIPCM